MTPAQALAALRARVKAAGLCGFLLPRADDALGEAVAAADERLARITGFRGSAGLAFAGLESGVLGVDGRYDTQAREEAGWGFAIVRTPPADFGARLRACVEAQPAPPAGPRKVGYDPTLHTCAGLERLARALGDAAALIAVDANPVDADWDARPPRPAGPWRTQANAGRAAAEKRRACAEALTAKGAQAAVLTTPESIAWLLNARADDYPHLPCGRAVAIVRADASVALFADPARVGDSVSGDGVEVAPREALDAALDGLGGAPVLYDSARLHARAHRRLEAAGARLIAGGDPCLALRAVKNCAEIAAAREAHVVDGAVLTRFLCWADANLADGTHTETSLAQRLDAMRLEAGAADLAFATISASGPNAAKAHHRPAARAVGAGDLYLVDSGGQYPQGATTDVTRTVAASARAITPFRKACFTRVLKGHIALARARFPAGTPGGRLDVLARAPLWEAGLDYDHGTGHGVGAYLSVHEGPQSFSQRDGSAALEPGMITSNEPGYYREGDFGVRHENLTLVVPAPAAADAPEDARPMLALETLTLAPFDLRCVDFELLGAQTRAWLDAYHARVRATLDGLLDAQTRAWLARATDG